MNKAQIKAELRRSACEDLSPFPGIKYGAFDLACDWKELPQLLADLTADDLRTFYLLVAEAL